MEVPSVLVEAVKGGTGKTTVTTNLAHRLSSKLKVGLIDADIDSPNLPEIFGIHDKMKLDDKRRFVPVQVNDNLKMFSMAAFYEGENLAYTMPGTQNRGVLRDAVKSTDWGDIDIMIIDLPAGSSDEFRAVKQLMKNIIGTIVVTLPSTISDFKRAIAIGEEHRLPMIGVIENMTHIKCYSCDAINHLYSDDGLTPVKAICELYGFNYFGGIPYSRSLHSMSLGEGFLLPDDFSEPIMKAMEVILNE